MFLFTKFSIAYQLFQSLAINYFYESVNFKKINIFEYNVKNNMHSCFIILFEFDAKIPRY